MGTKHRITPLLLLLLSITDYHCKQTWPGQARCIAITAIPSMTIDPAVSTLSESLGCFDHHAVSLRPPDTPCFPKDGNMYYFVHNPFLSHSWLNYKPCLSPNLCVSSVLLMRNSVALVSQMSISFHLFTRNSLFLSTGYPGEKKSKQERKNPPHA